MNKTAKTFKLIREIVADYNKLNQTNSEVITPQEQQELDRMMVQLNQERSIKLAQTCQKAMELAKTLQEESK